MPSNTRSTKKKKRNAARPCNNVLDDAKPSNVGSAKKACDTMLEGVPLKNRSSNNRMNATAPTARPYNAVLKQLPANDISAKNVDSMFKGSSIHLTEKQKNRRLKSRDLCKLLSDETMQGIKRGSVDITEVALQLVAMRKPDRFRNKFATIGETTLRLASSELAKMAFGVESKNNEDLRVTIAVVNLAKDLFRSLCKVTSENPPCVSHSRDVVDMTGSTEKDAREYIVLMKTYQQEHDRILLGATPDIVRLTGNVPSSPAFLAPLWHFFVTMGRHLFGQDFIDQIDIEVMEAGVACFNVATGQDQRRTSCWECGAECEDVQKCCGCMAARFCGPECQLKSWKGGHNKSCERLKFQYQFHQKNTKAVAKALKAGSIGASCTIPPNPHIDSEILTTVMKDLFLSVLLVPIDRRGELVNKMAIEIAYKFIRDLACGGSHFCLVNTPRTEPSSSFDTNTGESRKVQDIDEKEIRYVCKTLELFLLGDPSSADVKAIILDGMKNVHPRGELMTVERFLYIYATYDRSKDLEDEHEILVPAHVAWDFYSGELFDTLRERYHKNVISTSTQKDVAFMAGLLAEVGWDLSE